MEYVKTGIEVTQPGTSGGPGPEGAPNRPQVGNLPHKTVDTPP